MKTLNVRQFNAIWASATILLCVHLGMASGADSLKKNPENQTEECKNKQLAPFFIGATYESVEDAEYSFFKVLKEKKSDKAGGYLRQFTAGKDYIVDGYMVFTGKKDSDVIIMTELMINSTKPETILEYIQGLGTPQKVLQDQNPPNNPFPDVMKNWTQKLWMFDSCGLGIVIYEYSGNKPDKGFFVYRAIDLNAKTGK